MNVTCKIFELWKWLIFVRHWRWKKLMKLFWQILAILRAWNFSWNVFQGTYYCQFLGVVNFASISKIGPQKTKSKMPGLTDQLLEYQKCSSLISIVSNNVFIVISVVFLKRTNHVSDQNSNISQGFWFVQDLWFQLTNHNVSRSSASALCHLLFRFVRLERMPLFAIKSTCTFSSTCANWYYDTKYSHSSVEFGFYFPLL